MRRAKAASFLRIALVLAPLSAGLAACETLENLNPFDDTKKTPLSGDRRALFPQGVPGVEQNAPPQQPTNSNIQIPPQEQAPQPQAAPEPEQQPTKQTQRNQKKRSNAGADDPWAERR